jgi:hypothetical protein
VPEVRRIILALVRLEEEHEFRLSWLLWRRAQKLWLAVAILRSAVPSIQKRVLSPSRHVAMGVRSIVLELTSRISHRRPESL